MSPLSPCSSRAASGGAPAPLARLALALALLSACPPALSALPDPCDPNNQLCPATAGPPLDSSSGPDDPTTGAQTLTGPIDQTTSGASSTSGTSEPGEQNAPPKLDVSLSTYHLSEAGPAILEISTSSDVVKLSLLIDGLPAPSPILPSGRPDHFTYTYEALSSVDNTPPGEPRVFSVEALNGDGDAAADSAELTVQLPQSGTPKCLFKDKDVLASSVAALVYADDAIVAVGSRDVGEGPRAAIWKLHPDHCDVLPGWPRTIDASDKVLGPLGELPSRASAVALDPAGNIAVAYNLTVEGVPYRYVALYTALGARLWHKVGKPGDEVAGIAVAPDAVVAVGWTRTTGAPTPTDAAIWHHIGDQEPITVLTETLRAPFSPGEVFQDPNNSLSERAHAVLYDADSGLLFITGERGSRPDQTNTFARTFLARAVPAGPTLATPWTSPGEVLPHDSGAAITRCGTDVLVAGWTREGDPKPLTRWFDAQGAAVKHVQESMSATQASGIACDRDGKILHAAIYFEAGTYDAEVYAFKDPLGPRLPYETGVDGNDVANTVDCDSRGFCAWGGSRPDKGKSVAIIRVHHP